MSKFLISFVLATALSTQVLAAVSPAIIPNDRVVFGKTGSAVKTLEANLSKAGASTNPKQQYNPTSGKWEFSNDGTNFKSLGSGSGGGGGIQLLDNADFESGITSKWTDSASTVTLESVAPLFDSKSFIFTPTASAQYYTSDAVTIPVGLRGANCMASVYYKSAEVTNLVKLQAYDGTNVVGEVSLPASSNVTQGTVNFVCPSSGTLAVRLASTGTAAALTGDNAYIGSASNLGTVAQATLVGTLKYAATASCDWPTTSSSFANLSAVGACPAPTVTGSVTAPGTKIPGFVLSNAGPGEYLVIASASGYSDAGNQFGLQLSDGTTSSGAQTGTSTTTSNLIAPYTLVGRFSYTTSQSSLTIQIQGARLTGSGTVQLAADSTGKDLEFTVYKFPSSSEQAVRPEHQNYDWTSYTPTFTNFGTVSNTECLHKRDGSDQLIRCKFTSTSPAGSEGRVSLGGGVTSADTGKIPSIQNAGTYIYNRASTSHGGFVLMEPSVGYVTFSSYDSFGNTSLNALAKANGSNITDSTYGISFEARVPIQGWIQTNSAPLLVGSVTSNSAGAFKLESAVIGTTDDTTGCSSGTCTTFNASAPGWATGVWNSTGSYTVTMVGFSSKPVCICGNSRLAGLLDPACSVTSATSLSVRTANTSNVAQDEAFSIICFGPR